MIFNSIEYAIFLPIVFLLYWGLKKNMKLQNLFIVAVSYLFYGWWNWRFLILIAFTSLCSWVSGLLIERYRTPYGKAINIANIVVNLGILGLYKYYDFFAQSFADAFLGGHSDKLLLQLILPVGISFYTFQALSYSIDVYRQKLKPTRDIVQFFAFVSFFPQLVAGPIERATNLLPQFEKPRAFRYPLAADGMRQILWGLFKKIVIADNCAQYVDTVFNNYPAYSASTKAVAAILFAIQIYCDFSGYSEIAIGSAKLFGIELRRNFHVPYFSRDVAEFWRRWHISLTTWFRDYVYIPLGGSRCSKRKVVRNTFVIFLLSGMWHGANWTFLAWGAFHAMLFIPLILLGKNRKHTDAVAMGRVLPSIKELGQMVLTFALVTIGWILFRADSIEMAGHYIAGMASASLFRVPWIPSKWHIGPLIIAIIAMTLVEWIDRSQEHPFTLRIVRQRWLRWAIYLALLAAIVLRNPGTGNQFIYFQF